VNDARGAFSESGLALRPGPEGRDRLLMNYTHPKQVPFEVKIPQLVKIGDARYFSLNTAEVRKVWGALTLTPRDQQAMSPNRRRSPKWTHLCSCEWTLSLERGIHFQVGVQTCQRIRQSRGR
jgi:hypothetical protein